MATADASLSVFSNFSQCHDPPNLEREAGRSEIFRPVAFTATWHLRNYLGLEFPPSSCHAVNSCPEDPTCPGTTCRTRMPKPASIRSVKCRPQDAHIPRNRTCLKMHKNNKFCKENSFMLRPLQVHISKCNVTATASPRSPRLEAFPREQHEPCNSMSRRQPWSFVRNFT